MAKTLTDSHYYDCPECVPPQQVHWFARDLRKQNVYECSQCGHKFGESRLKREHGERIMRD